MENQMINDVNDAATVVYNQARIDALRAAWGDGWHSATELFVNGNEPNVNNAAQASFEERFSFDTVNEAAYPVLIYQNGTQMVAWYDIENMRGYVA